MQRAHIFDRCIFTIPKKVVIMIFHTSYCLLLPFVKVLEPLVDELLNCIYIGYYKARDRAQVHL